MHSLPNREYSSRSSDSDFTNTIMTFTHQFRRTIKGGALSLIFPFPLLSIKTLSPTSNPNRIQTKKNSTTQYQYNSKPKHEHKHKLKTQNSKWVTATAVGTTALQATATLVIGIASQAPGN
jgi:hypothetical protein